MDLVKYDTQFSISCCRFHEQVFPWEREDVFTTCWRLYWDSTPGAELLFQNQRYCMTPENIYIISGGTTFSHRASQPFDRFFMHFSLNDELACANRIFVIPATQELKEKIHQISHHVSDNYPDFLKRTLLAQIVLATALLALPGDVLTLPRKIDDRITKVCRHIATHLNGDLSNPALARLCNIDPVSFSRLFRREMKCTPQYYVGEKRVQRACELFHAECYSIEEIAELTGFSNRYYFSRVFKKYLHMSPAAFYRLAKEHSGCIA